jgi:hypothetical protein
MVRRMRATANNTATAISSSISLSDLRLARSLTQLQVLATTPADRWEISYGILRLYFDTIASDKVPLRPA